MADADRKGYVYLIVNDQIMGRVKIGYTMREPIDRAYELVSTGTTGTFVVIYQALVVNPRDVETEVHRRLASHNRGLEWFEVCPNLAKQAILSCVETVLYEETVAKWHPSQPEPHSWARTVLQEARLAAEEVARKQEEAEEEAKRLAEEELIRKAKVDEEARKQAELAEHRKRAEEAVRAAEEAAEEVKRKQQELIEAERRREQAEQRKSRLERYVRTGSPVVGAGLVLSALIYFATRPVTPQEYLERQHAVLTLSAKVTNLRGSVWADQRQLQADDAAIRTLPQERQRLVDLRESNAAEVAEWSRKLEIAADKLKGFEQNKKDPLQESTEGWFQYRKRDNHAERMRLHADIDYCESKLKAAELKVAHGISRLQTIPKELKAAEGSAKRLRPLLTKAKGELSAAESALASAQVWLSRAERSVGHGAAARLK